MLTTCAGWEHRAPTPATATTPSTASGTWPWTWPGRYRDSGTEIAADSSAACKRQHSRPAGGYRDTSTADDHHRGRRVNRVCGCGKLTSCSQSRVGECPVRFVL